MADDDKGQPVVGDTQTEQPAVDTSEELKKQIAADLETKYKKELSTRDQAITKLQKDLSLKQSEEERIKQAQDNERKELLSDYAKIAIQGLGLTDEMSELVTGNSKDEIISRLEAIKNVKAQIEKPLLDKIKQLEDLVKIKQAEGAAPEGGQGSNAKIIKRAAFDGMSGDQKMSFFKNGGKVED
jgi:uncharacterized protein YgfB (UPF0149 family)